MKKFAIAGPLIAGILMTAHALRANQPPRTQSPLQALEATAARLRKQAADQGVGLPEKRQNILPADGQVNAEEAATKQNKEAKQEAALETLRGFEAKLSAFRRRAGRDGVAV